MVAATQRFKCCATDCIKPVARRLGLFQKKDDYECYSESYIKGFWDLCDIRTKSIEGFATAKVNTQVITVQPKSVLQLSRKY